MVNTPFSPPPQAGPVITWLLNEARTLPSGPAALKELGLRLNAAGLSLARASFHVRTLHPQFFGIGFFWYRGEDEIQTFLAQHGIRDTDLYQRSPLRLIFEEEVEELHQSLEQPDEVLPFLLFAELKADGFTDYLALPLMFSDGKIHCTTWVTDKAGGFDDDDVALIKSILPIFGLLIEIHLNRRIAINILNTYVGREAGERILEGQITRGSGETIPAAIWFSDLRGFTPLSEEKGRDELLAILNQSFDALVTPVTERGGEVLKFIGDAVLAIFPLTEENACGKALEAAIEAQAALAATNRERKERGEDVITAGIALHIGEVMYGNIGSATRLDFTVIGPAVNLASRIEGLCRDLGVDLLLSSAFKNRLDSKVPLTQLGHHRLKGVKDEVAVFSPSAGLVA
ncbi:MAG: adenylate/guanylate cyclase domain-containing protein [Geminicoccaceae bacterium]